MNCQQIANDRLAPMSVAMRHDADVGYVVMEAPTVNGIGQSVRQELLDAVHWAEKLRLTRVILSSIGQDFVPVADLRDADAPLQEPHLTDVTNAIDQSFVPWIAAIDGVALGQGAEIAMACRMRIMAPNAQIGMPDVTLGVVPGAGGTQRLPRLVGLAKGLEMICFGEPLGSVAALASGLIDAIEDDPVAEAYMVNTEELGCIVPTWERPAPDWDASIVDKMRQAVATKSPHHLAPRRAIDVVEAGLSMPFHQALAGERATYLELRSGAEAKALWHMLFAERGAKAPAGIESASVPLDHLAIVSGGAMGERLASSVLAAGVRVTLVAADSDGAMRAQAHIEKIIAARLAHGMVDEPAVKDWRDRFTATTDYAHAADARLAIYITDDVVDVVQERLVKLNVVLPQNAVLATNMSHVAITEIAAALPDPTRLVGLHVCECANRLKLLEIVPGTKTSATARATGLKLAELLHVTPVLAARGEGSMRDRILARYHEAADTVFMDGSTPWEVDEAMEAFGYRMGPYEAQDLSGLDGPNAIRRRQDAARDPDRRYIPIADRMLELGKLGKKTGAGWYRYPGGNGKVEDPIVADLAIEESHFAGRTRTDYAAQEISTRLVLAMINEAADLLDEGIAQSARDIDLVTVLGCGFPRWRGGLMHYADRLGARTIVAQIEALAREDPVAWRVSPVLRYCVQYDLLLEDYGFV